MREVVYRPTVVWSIHIVQKVVACLCRQVNILCYSRIFTDLTRGGSCYQLEAVSFYYDKSIDLWFIFWKKCCLYTQIDGNWDWHRLDNTNLPSYQYCGLLSGYSNWGRIAIEWFGCFDSICHQLEEKYKEKINPEFKDKINFQAECDLFVR